ncbi:hypothetical protein HMPREF1870_02240 [Bacteroidales bacterium KA00344]|nr:hypothetical protein HMPREF1870_02240 [Bacteroidales bacterium KA00344]
MYKASKNIDKHLLKFRLFENRKLIGQNSSKFGAFVQLSDSQKDVDIWTPFIKYG